MHGKVVLTFNGIKFVGGILKYDHLNQSKWVVMKYCSLYAAKSGSMFLTKETLTLSLRLQSFSFEPYSMLTPHL